MEFLHLVIPYNEFVEKYSDFKRQLEKLYDDLETVDAQQVNKDFQSLDSQVILFFEESFYVGTDSYNKYLSQYRHGLDSLSELFFGVGDGSLIDTLKRQIKEKIKVITYHLEFIDTCDLIKNPSPELYEERQNFTVKEKKDLLLVKLSQLDSNKSHNVKAIYLGNGLKITHEAELHDICQGLYTKKYIEYNGMNNDTAATIKIYGREYVEKLNQQEYNTRTRSNNRDNLSEKDKRALKDLFNTLRSDLKADIQEEFKGQQEFIVVALNALYEVIDESLLLIDSKLEKKTIRQAILGKAVEMAAEKAMEPIAGKLWSVLKTKLMSNSDAAELITNGKALFLKAMAESQ